MEAMKYCKTAFALGAASAVILSGADASAGFWTPLDTVPQPNFVIGMDTSVTMGIRSDCSSCHSPSNPNTRLNEAKTDILATLPMFKKYFVFGAFDYAGCGSAHVNSRVLPTPANPNASYNAVSSLVSGVGHCGSRENTFPSGGGPMVGCITPSAACVNDPPVVNSVLSGGVPGLGIPAPTIAIPNSNVACDTANPVSPTFNLAASLISKFGAGNFSWPRWDPATITGGQVNTDLCTPLRNVLTQVSAELNGCFVDPTTIWDMSFLGNNSWCDPGVIANNGCTGASPLNGTCVCDSTQAGCVSASIPSSECSKLLTFRARQQIGVCEMYSTAQTSRFGSYFLSQSDNIANGQCRENVGIFITDGYEGHQPGVAAEAVGALNFYRSADALSNLFVFRISSVFNGSANSMMSYVSAGQTNTAYQATDRATMQESFAKVLSRIYKGVYTGANMAMDRYQTRAVFHSFTVPGYNGSGPVSDNYLGFPSRISVHSVSPAGVVQPIPLYESDWTSRVNAPPTCGGYTLSGRTSAPGYMNGGNDAARLGPGGRFRNNVDRSVTVAANSTDRDGDDLPDNHPSLTYGRSYGFAAGAALVVDAPEDAKPATGDGNELSAYLNFRTNNAVQQRPRVIYYTDGGYLIGVHGGNYTPGSSLYGNQKLAFSYDDASAPAGAEVLRYQPSWLNPAAPGNGGLSYQYDYAANDLIQQPLIEGELIAKEAYVDLGGPTPVYRTVLIANQGKDGPGFFVIDVSEPCSPPSFARDIRLPAGDYASAEPTLYLVPRSSAPTRRSVLITTGGLGGSSNIYAYDIVTGNQMASRSLPSAAGQSYPSAPVCVDVTGEGVVTHCYALRSDGYLARVEVRLDSFGPVANLTPIDGSGNFPSMSAGRKYFTSPVAYFGQDGAVNIVFGSGDYQNLTSAAAANAVFRARDVTTRQQGVPAGPARLDQVCRPNGSGVTEGVLNLGPGERVLSKPIVSGGVVAWTTYVSASSGCVAGSGLVYAMDFETCEDVLSPGNSRPAGSPTGAGIPTSPVLHGQSETVLVQSSAGPTGGQVQSDAANTRSGGNPMLKRLYWRLKVDNP